jgi:hypothetical protein
MSEEKKISLAGRPALYDDEEEFKAKIEEYFTEVGIKSTITGLAYFLGFESRQSFYDYADRGKFSYIGKRARLFIESCYESKLSGNNPTGPIFFLKNMGWKDRTEIAPVDPDGNALQPSININLIQPKSG